MSWSERMPSTVGLVIRIVVLLFILSILWMLFNMVISPLVGDINADPARSMRGTWEGTATTNLSTDYLQKDELNVRIVVDSSLNVSGSIGDATIPLAIIGRDAWVARALGIGKYRAWFVFKGLIVRKEKFERKAGLITFSKPKGDVMKIDFRSLDRVRPDKPRLVMKGVLLHRVSDVKVDKQE